MSAEERLQRAALEMIAAAERGRSVLASLRARCAPVLRQIRRDARFPGLLSLWGRCVNFDEHARQVIVHPAILRAIGEAAGVPMRGRIVHAGLQHTYGYLFSLIETPYGAKRDRWVTSDLERGLGVGQTLLGAQPCAGTLLANATWVLGRIAFRGRAAESAVLARQAAAAAPALAAYDFSTLEVCRLVERVVTGTSRRAVSLVTDLVTLPRAPQGDRLLIYSTANGSRAPLRLVTAFPVRPDAAERLRAARPGRADVELRYNAYVPGLLGRRCRGHARRIDQN